MALTPRRTARRTARRLTERQRAITSWWHGLPEPRPDYITSFALALALGRPVRRVAGALRAMGWRCLVRRVHGRKVTLWLPPGSPITKRPRGRPRRHTFP